MGGLPHDNAIHTAAHGMWNIVHSPVRDHQCAGPVQLCSVNALPLPCHAHRVQRRAPCGAKEPAKAGVFTLSDRRLCRDLHSRTVQLHAPVAGVWSPLHPYYLGRNIGNFIGNLYVRKPENARGNRKESLTE